MEQPAELCYRHKALLQFVDSSRHCTEPSHADTEEIMKWSNDQVRAYVDFQHYITREMVARQAQIPDCGSSVTGLSFLWLTVCGSCEIRREHVREDRDRVVMREMLPLIFEYRIHHGRWHEEYCVSDRLCSNHPGV